MSNVTACVDPRSRSRLFRFVSGTLPAILFLCWDAGADTGADGAAYSTLRPQLHLPAGPAGKALTELALQTDIDILFDSADVEGVFTKPLAGAFSASEALEQILRGTNLTYVWDDQRATIRRREIPPRPQEYPVRLVDVFKAPDVVTVSTDRRHALGNLSAGSERIALYSREDIEESGVSDLVTLLRTRSQVFGGGPTEGTILGREAGTNAMYGTGVNLRGLGAGATLILLDGHRLAPSGSSGAFTDVSNIPLSAVNSIEILPDATATPYGADAPGGVVNINMWREFSGAQVQTRYGAVTDGAVHEHRYDAISGNSWEWGRGMVAGEYYDRSELPARDRSEVTGDFSSLGGDDFLTDYGNPGTVVADGHPYAIPRSQPGIAANYVRDTANNYNIHDLATILPGQKRVSGLGSLQFDFNPHLKGFLDVLVTNRDVTASNAAEFKDLTVGPDNPFYVNPAGGRDPVTVKYSFGPDLGPQVLRGNVLTANGFAGLNWYPDRWHLGVTLDYALEKEDQTTTGLVNFDSLDKALAQGDPGSAFNPFGHTGDTVLDSIRASRRFSAHSYYYGSRLALDGPLMLTPAGDIKLALGAEFRRQNLTAKFTQTAPVLDEKEAAGRHIRSGFAQICVPLLGPAERIGGAGRLEVSAALRFDDYSDVGHAIAPSYGISWSPVPRVTFRGTLSRSVRPPTPLDRLELNNQSVLLGLPDGLRTTQTLIWYGNNAQLAPESSRSWTAGITLKPFAALDSSVALTFFNIHIRNRIDQPDFSSAALQDPLFQERVTRNPTAAQIQTVCTRSVYQQGSTAECAADQVDAILDIRLRNTAALATSGVDLLTKLEWPLERSRLGAELSGTYLLEYAETPAPNLPPTSLLNRQHEPINLRLRGSAFWKYRGLQLSTVVAYANHYRDWVNSRNVASWTTVDLNASYAIVPAGPAALSNISVAIAAQNVFNRAPPFLDNQAVGIGYDQENSGVLGRLLSVSLRKRW